MRPCRSVTGGSGDRQGRSRHASSTRPRGGRPTGRSTPPRPQRTAGCATGAGPRRPRATAFPATGCTVASRIRALSSGRTSGPRAAQTERMRAAVVLKGPRELGHEPLRGTRTLFGVPAVALLRIGVESAAAFAARSSAFAGRPPIRRSSAGTATSSSTAHANGQATAAARSSAKVLRSFSRLTIRLAMKRRRARHC